VWGVRMRFFARLLGGISSKAQGARRVLFENGRGRGEGAVEKGKGLGFHHVWGVDRFEKQRMREGRGGGGEGEVFHSRVVESLFSSHMGRGLVGGWGEDGW